MSATTLDLINEVRPMVSWNSFAASVVSYFDRKGKISEGQETALRAMLRKMAANNAAKAANSGKVDVSAIETLFAGAVSKGYKKPKFRAIGLEISLASANGINAGALYVKGETGQYLGKIKGGAFSAVGTTPAGTVDTLRQIAENPRKAAVDYGKLYGRCGCCGRDLTDPHSIAAGIGPVCAEKWGL